MSLAVDEPVVPGETQSWPELTVIDNADGVSLSLIAARINPYRHGQCHRIAVAGQYLDDPEILGVVESELRL